MKNYSLENSMDKIWGEHYKLKPERKTKEEGASQHIFNSCQGSISAESCCENKSW